MMKTMRRKVTVQPGGVIEIYSPELIPGTSAEVIVLVDDSENNRPLSDWLGAVSGIYSSPQDVDDFLRKERDRWES